MPNLFIPPFDPESATAYEETLAHTNHLNLAVVREPITRLPYWHALLNDLPEWSESKLHEAFQMRGAEAISLCDAAGIPLAGAIFWGVFENYDLLFFSVDSRYRRKGFGRFLLVSIMAHMRELQGERVCLEVRISNEQARRLYESCGFQKVSIRPNYYAPTPEKPFHEDAVSMIAKL